jgi:hypothetical protein
MMMEWKQVPIGRSGPASAASSELPECPAIYAFFLNVELEGEPTHKRLVAHIERLLSMELSRRFAGHFGMYSQFLARQQLWVETPLMRSSELINERVELLGPPEHLKAVLSVLQRIMPPLYVGEADGLAKRIARHLRPSSDLSKRLEDCGIQRESLTLKYLELPSTYADAYLMASPAEGEHVTDSEVEEDDDQAEFLDDPDTEPEEDFLMQTFKRKKESAKQAAKSPEPTIRRRFVEEIFTQLTLPGFSEKVGPCTWGEEVKDA